MSFCQEFQVIYCIYMHNRKHIRHVKINEDSSALSGVYILT